MYEDDFLPPQPLSFRFCFGRRNVLDPSLLLSLGRVVFVLGAQRDGVPHLLVSQCEEDRRFHGQKFLTLFGFRGILDFPVDYFPSLYFPSRHGFGFEVFLEPQVRARQSVSVSQVPTGSVCGCFTFPNDTDKLQAFHGV